MQAFLAWGARGPEFKSRRPDQIPQRLTTKAFITDCVLESSWSPKRTPAEPPPGHTKNIAQIPGAWRSENPPRLGAPPGNRYERAER